MKEYVKAFAESIDDSYIITHDVIVYWAKLIGIDLKSINTEGLVPIKLISDCPLRFCMDFMWEVHLPTGKSAHQCDLYSYSNDTSMFSGGYKYDSSKEKKFNEELKIVLKEWCNEFENKNPYLESLGLIVVNVILHIFDDKEPPLT